MNNIIKNKNLFLAERLLKIIAQKPQLVVGDNSLSLKKEFIPELSREELVKSLKGLERRKAIRFRHKGDKLVTYARYMPYIDLVFNKNKLLEFIEIAKDKVYKITTQYKKNLKYVLGALNAFLQPKFLHEEQIEFSEEVENKYIKIAEWIADYSEIIKVVYVHRSRGDIKWSKTKKAPVANFSEQPKELEILDRSALEQLNNEIRQFAIKPYQKRIKLFLNKNPETGWRCANCGRFFKKQELIDEGKIGNHLIDFAIHKFKSCHACRKRNYFSISPTGEIKSLLARPEKKEKVPKL